MPKISLQQIQEEASFKGWKLYSTSYKNLTTELEWACPEGHIVYASYKKIRNTYCCPQCQQQEIEKTTTEIKAKKKGSFRVLALDQATQTSGWAIFDDKELIAYGKINFTQTDSIDRTSRIRQWLINMINNWIPDKIAFEDIQLQTFQKNGRSSEAVTTYKTLAFLQGVLMVTALEKNISYSIVHAATWRAFCKITAKSRADQKRAAQLWVQKKYNKNATQDEADAICIGSYMVEKFIKNNTMIDFNSL